MNKARKKGHGPERRARDQIKKLADFIVDEIPGEPSRDESAIDTAIRLLRGDRHCCTPGAVEIARRP